MIDVRIATDSDRVEILSKTLRDSLFADFGVSVSSIIPTTDSSVVRRAAKGADILLVAAKEKEEIGDLSVGHVEYVKLDANNGAEIERALREGMIRSAIQVITAFSQFRDMEKEMQGLRQKEQEYQEMRKAYAELKEKEIYLERILEESEKQKKRIQELENELDIVRKRRHDYYGREVKDLLSFPLDDLWTEIARTPPPRNEDIEVAVKRLNIEGSVMVSCGYLAAPSREEALDILRIVKITQDLQKQTRY